MAFHAIEKGSRCTRYSAVLRYLDPSNCAAIVRLEDELGLAFDRFVQQPEERIESCMLTQLEATLCDPQDSR